MKNTSEKGMVPFFPHRGDELEHMEELLKSMLPDLSLTVIACEVKDWNLELSPWKGVSIDGRILGGGGSGSFWVDGWSDYAKTHALRKKASIYLSLGGKEDKTVCLMAGGIFYACVAQMVEHPTFNRMVAGSIPVTRSFARSSTGQDAGLSCRKTRVQLPVG